MKNPLFSNIINAKIDKAFNNVTQKRDRRREQRKSRFFGSQKNDARGARKSWFKPPITGGKSPKRSRKKTLRRKRNERNRTQKRKYNQKKK